MTIPRELVGDMEATSIVASPTSETPKVQAGIDVYNTSSEPITISGNA